MAAHRMISYKHRDRRLVRPCRHETRTYQQKRHGPYVHVHVVLNVSVALSDDPEMRKRRAKWWRDRRYWSQGRSLSAVWSPHPYALRPKPRLTCRDSRPCGNGSAI